MAYQQLLLELEVHGKVEHIDKLKSVTATGGMYQRTLLHKLLRSRTRSKDFSDEKVLQM